MTTTTLAPPDLDTGDRCDRCGAQAYVHVAFPRGGELLFCGHHWNRHAESLCDLPVVIDDQTHRLTGRGED